MYDIKPICGDWIQLGDERVGMVCTEPPGHYDELKDVGTSHRAHGWEWARSVYWREGEKPPKEAGSGLVNR